MDINERALMERLTTGVSEMIGPDVAASLSLEQIHEMLERYLVTRLTAKVLSRAVIRDTRTYHVDHPTSWWQHLKVTLYKKRWFTRRIVRRWPVKWGRTEIRVGFSQYETYPKAKTMLPPSQFGYPVVVETVSHDIDSDFPVLFSGSLTPKNDCMEKPELVNYLLKYAFRKDPYGIDPRPLAPTDIYNMLAGLESLGVHTAGLVKKGAIR